MIRKCPQCGKEYSPYNYVCSVCETELIDNGQLIEALSLSREDKSSPVTRIVVSLGLITAFGVASALLDTHLILLVGIAASAFYYFRSSKSQVHP